MTTIFEVSDFSAFTTDEIMLACSDGMGIKPMDDVTENPQLTEDASEKYEEIMQRIRKRSE